MNVADLFGNSPTKRCTKCRQVLPLEAFKIDRSRVHGRSYVCRGCERVVPAHIPTSKQRAVAWHRHGKAWCCDCDGWVAISDMAAQFYRCKTHQRPADRNRYASDEAHREERRAHAARRKRGVERVPPEGRELLTHIFEGECAYCDQPATGWDHVVPITKGGLTTPDNILPSCASCNSSKKNQDLLLWLDAPGRSMKPQAWERLSHYQVLEL